MPKKNVYILVILFFAVSLFVFEYYYLTPKTEQMKETIESEYTLLQKYEYFAKNAGKTDDEIKTAAKDIKEIEKKLIQEKSEFLASVKLQNEITGMTGKAGLTVMTIRPLGPVKSKDYSSIPIYFEGNGNIKQFADFMKYVESGDLLLKVDKLNLNITNMQNPKELKFKIQVSGLMKT